MKAYFLFFGVILCFVMISCSTSTSSQEGYLTINNTTNGIAFVSASGGHSVTVQSHSSSTLTIDTGKSVSAHISYNGDYIASGSDNVDVTTNHTSTYDLFADCGRLRINNNSDSDLQITFPGKSSYTLSPNSYDTYKISLPNGQTGYADFDYEGLYTFSGNATIVMDSDELSTYTVNANGGAININNNSSYTIQHIYLSPASNNFWGSDALIGNLYSGNSAIWTVGQGNWDIKVVDSYGDAYFIYDEHVSLNQTLNINYYDKKSSLWNRINKKQSGKGDFQSAKQYLIFKQNTTLGLMTNL